MNETIREMLDIIRSLKDIANLSGDDLSSKALVLSINKVFVGQKLVEYEYQLSHNKTIRKSEWGNSFREATGTVDERKIFADGSVKKMVKDEIELERKIGTLKNLRADCSDLISMIQTRLSQLRSELAEIKSN